MPDGHVASGRSSNVHRGTDPGRASGPITVSRRPVVADRSHRHVSPAGPGFGNGPRSRRAAARIASCAAPDRQCPASRAVSVSRTARDNLHSRAPAREGWPEISTAGAMNGQARSAVRHRQRREHREQPFAGRQVARFERIEHSVGVLLSQVLGEQFILAAEGLVRGAFGHSRRAHKLLTDTDLFDQCRSYFPTQTERQDERHESIHRRDRGR